MQKNALRKSAQHPTIVLPTYHKISGWHGLGAGQILGITRTERAAVTAPLETGAPRKIGRWILLGLALLTATVWAFTKGGA